MVKNRKDLTPRRSLRAGSSKQAKGNANIRVVVRVRPPNIRENNDNFRNVVKVLDEASLIFDPEEDSTPFFYHGVQQKGRDLLKKAHKNMKFTFDRVFGPDAANDDVFYDSTKELIDILMDGYNCSVFVYGATGAGKTYTMLGGGDHPGITLLTMRELFKQKEALSNEREFELAVSYLEVYNEMVKDLLKPGVPLHLREDSNMGVMVANITIHRIENPDDLFALLDKGNRSRTQHPTDANAESSRSHAVFQVYIQMKMNTTGQKRLAKLSMIDLAGSERGAATGYKGVRFNEGSNINRSLLALGNCINSLADGQRHVPYRDSKLTRLLKDSLGGNCHTVMIANVSPSAISIEDTYNTLKYATRAKKIKSTVKKNVVNSDLNSIQYKKIIEELTNEIEKLKQQMAEQKAAAPVSAAGECEKCKAAAAAAAAAAANNNSSSELGDCPAPTTNLNITTTNTTSYGGDMSSNEVKLRQLYEEYTKLQDRIQCLKLNKHMLDVRIDLKEEANLRLSGFCADTPEREKGHKRLTHTIDRLKRQTHTFHDDLESLKAKLDTIQYEINQLRNGTPDLKQKIEIEQQKIDLIKADCDLDELRNVIKLQEAELKVRGNLMEDMSRLLKPWYLLLRSSGLTTDSMTRDYQSLSSRVLGACTVTFEDSGGVDSGLSTTSSTTSTQEENRPPKRKLQDDLDATFVYPRSTSNNKNHILAKVCQPSPPKRPAKSIRSSPRILQSKESNRTNIKPTAAMGTAARFPHIPSSRTRLQKVRPITTDRPMFR